MKKTLLLLNIFLFFIGVSAALAQVPSYVPTNGLVGYWPFNGNANDESGNGNNGTVNGATLTTDRFGVANKAYNFNGSSSKIVVPNSPSLNISTGQSLTISCWIKHNSGATNVNTYFISKYNGFSSIGPAYAIGTGTIGNAYSWHQIASGIPNGIEIIADNPMNDGNWHQVVSILDMGNNSRVYIDGVLDSTVNFPLVGSIINTINLHFGCGANLAQYYSGNLDDIAIYNRVLTLQEITNLYTSAVPPPPPTASITPSASQLCTGGSTTLTASTSVSNVSACASTDLPATLQNGLVGYWPFCGNANDASGNGNNGTVNGATLTSDRFGNANSAYSFDGAPLTNITMNISQNIEKLTFSAWVNYEILNTYYPHVAFFSSSTSSVGQLGYLAFLGDNPSYLNNGLSGFLQSYPNYLQSNNSVSSGAWHHLVVVYSASINNHSIYIDGQLNATGNATSLLPLINGYKMTIGNSIDGWNGLVEYGEMAFNGKIDDIAIWNRALTAAEIQQLYTQGQTTYSWSPSGETTPSITVSPTSTTTYTCTATVNGQTATASQTITVNPLPAVNAGIDVNVCTGNSTTLSGSGANTYTWDNNVTNGVAFTPATSGTYTVTGTDANGCVNSDQVLVTVNALPTINAGSDQMICAGTAITLNGSGASTYAWDNNVSNGVAFTPASSGTYTVTGTNANGCTNSDQVFVMVHALPTVNAGTDQSVCSGTAVTLSASGSNTYAWNNNISNGVAFTPTASGTYSVTGTDANGCTNTDQVAVTVNPLPSVNAGADQSICKGAAVTLSGTGTTTYAWNNNVTNGVAFNPIATATYSVSGTDANGCTNSDEVIVTVNEASVSTLTESAMDSYTLNGQTYTQSGTYTQTLTNAAGCDSTITLNLTLSFTGLGELSQGISLSPNPTLDLIYIQSTEERFDDFVLIDPQGRTVFTGNLKGMNTALDLSKLANGQYILHIGRQGLTYRLIKQ